MPDTIRTQAELLVLFADNNTGDISAQDGRDFIVSIYDFAAPGGSNTQIQYNNAGEHGGDSGFTTNGAGSVNLVGDLDVDNINVNGNTISTTNTDGPLVFVPHSAGEFTGGIIYAYASSEIAGNARGRRSVDLQLKRSVATQVVSGTRSGAVGGQDSTVSGNNSFSGAARNCTISANYTGCFGFNNIVAGDYSLVSGIGHDIDSSSSKAMVGGQNNTLNGNTMTFIMGSGNTASYAQYNMINGRNNVCYDSEYSVLMGRDNNVSTARASFAFGFDHDISGNYNMAAGYNHTVAGAYAVVGGYSNTVTSVSVGSAVFGKGNSVAGDYLIVGGQNNTTVTGRNTIAVGRYLSASDFYTAVFGRSNTSSGGSGYSLVCGKGNSNSSSTYTIMGGRNNTISGCSKAFAFGDGNSVSNFSYQFAFGRTNTLNSANYQVAFGKSNNISSKGGMALGLSHTVSGVYSFAGGGYGNTVSGAYATAFGYRSVSSHRGQVSLAGGRFSANGDAQASLLVSRRSTTDNTQSELFLNGSSLRMLIPTDTTWLFSIFVAARRTDADNESASYKFEGCIDNNAGTTALVGTVLSTILAEDTAAWDVVVEADNTNDALVIKVTGETAKTIRWVALTTLVQVTG